MLNAFIQNARRNRGHGLTSMFRHLGALGLFFLAILDSSPLPTFGGPDILTAILAASHRNPWYEYAAVATVGSVIGALLTFRVARRAGSAYLHVKFGNRKLDAILSFFHKWGTSALAASTAVPFPFPTSVFFGVAGASNYGLGRFLTVVTICRAARYGIIAIVADHYGRHFIRALRQPGQYWGWLLLFAAAIFSLIIAGIAVNRRLSRILIVDDTRITRQQIRALLQDIAEWDVCGEAIDGLDAIAKTRELAPDVIVLDLAMPRMNGLDAAREIRKVAPRIPILMYTTFLTPQLIEESRRIGIRGTADKTDAGRSLVGGIRALLRNETFFPCSPTDLSVTGHEQNSGWESGSEWQETRDLERSRVRRSA